MRSARLQLKVKKVVAFGFYARDLSVPTVVSPLFGDQLLLVEAVGK